MSSPELLQEDYETYGAHAGVDIGHPESPNIYSVYEGLVVYAETDTDNRGNKIVIMYSYKGTAYYSFYFHLALIGVKVGQRVRTGENIGTMGNSGAVSIHLHLEIRTAEGIGPQPENGEFSFPWGKQYWWARSGDELHSRWLDISPRFGGVSSLLPENWR